MQDIPRNNRREGLKILIDELPEDYLPNIISNILNEPGENNGTKPRSELRQTPAGAVRLALFIGIMTLGLITAFRNELGPAGAVAEISRLSGSPVTAETWGIIPQQKPS